MASFSFRRRFPDVHIDHVALRIEVHVPHLLEQGGTPDYLLGVEEEVLQELELLGSEIKRTTIDGCRVSQPVHADRSELQRFHASAPPRRCSARTRARSSSNLNGLAR